MIMFSNCRFMFCYHTLFLAQMMLGILKTSGANVALAQMSCGANGRIFGANGFLPNKQFFFICNTKYFLL